MAYTDPGDAVPGAVITAAWGDAVRADVVESALARVAVKGDIVVATAANVLARLPVGADGTRLEADSGEATGIIWRKQPAARVYNSVAFDPAISAWDSIDFDSERYDTDALHAAAPNPDRLTCPDDADGIYHIGGQVRFDNSGGIGSNVQGLRILLNGAICIAQVLLDANLGLVDNSFLVSCDYPLSDNGGGANDYVELQVFTVTDVNVLAEPSYSPEFWIHFVRAI